MRNAPTLTSNSTSDTQEVQQKMEQINNATISISRVQRGESSLRSGFRGMSINLTFAERLGRVFVGATGAVAGAMLLASATSALAIVLEVLLTASGIDLIVTGALGHCPLYSKLGHVPASLRSPK